MASNNRVLKSESSGQKTAAGGTRSALKTASRIAPSGGAQYVATTYESRWNPLRGLAPEVLVQYIEMYEAGIFIWQDRTMRAMERRDDVWKISAAKARKDVSRRKWNIVPLQGFEQDDEAARQVETLQEFYASVQSTDHECRNISCGVRGLIEGAMRAFNDGFSVYEIVWKPTAAGLSAQLMRCPLEWFRLKQGVMCFVKDMMTEEPLQPNEWIVTRGDGVGITCSVAYMLKKMALADWAVYSGRCGHPGIHGKTNAAKGTDQWNNFTGALRAFGKEWACATGLEDVIEKIDLSVAGTLPYPALVERMDRAIASLQRGADLSTISSGAGSGRGASLQGEESDLICADNCEMITESFRSQLDPVVLRWTFGEDVEIKAGFRLLPPEAKNTDRDLKIDQILAGMGVRLSKRDALSRYERREVDADDPEDEPLTPPAKMPQPTERLQAANVAPELPHAHTHALLSAALSGDHRAAVSALAYTRNERLRVASRAALANALAMDLQPLRARIAAALQADDAGLAKALANCAADIPALLPQIAGNAETQKALEGALTAALFNGLAEGVAARPHGRKGTHS